MNIHSHCAFIAIALGLAACSDSSESHHATPSQKTSNPSQAASQPKNQLKNADIPVAYIPPIVVPDFLSMTPQQWQLQKRLPASLNPSSGIQVKPLACQSPKTDANNTTTQVIKTDQGTLLVDEGNGGLFSSDQLTVSLNDDGTGVLVAKLDDQTSFTVYGSNNGKGSYVGPEGRFDINGDGSGTWRKGSTTVSINKNGSATLHDERGLLTIKPDGSGTWQRNGGNAEYIENFGDGTGVLGSINPIKVKMAPWQVPPPVAAMPPIQKLPKPTASCGYIINLAENILFDYDKHELNPAAYPLLDELAQALQQTKVDQIEISGHTDSKGSDDYNLRLSLQRAQAVLQALQQRHSAGQATAHGYGEAQPVAPNEINGTDSPSNRQLNRRVEILVKTQ